MRFDCHGAIVLIQQFWKSHVAALPLKRYMHQFKGNQKDVEMASINDPRQIINFLRKDENKYIFGEGRDITGGWYGKDRHGICVQLRQFFGRARQGMTLHYEIEECERGIKVGIHSETKTPSAVHDFIKEQFEVQIKPKPNVSYRFATIEISWKGRTLDDIVTDIKEAVDTLYRKYDAYLNYGEGCYAGKGNIVECKPYAEFMSGLMA